MITTIEDLLNGKQKNEVRKNIEFKKVLMEYLIIEEDKFANPKDYDNIILLCKNYGEDYDLMLAYNNFDDSSDRVLYLGHWNDGVK